ncbi:MAG TPA: hypothetical protein VEL49_10290 [Ktedonobacteraceae bacterium]|nr:hypothetical protein [Ktedonobacteraceae bacterium]
MKSKRTAEEAAIGPVMLDKPPHILPQLMEIVEGDWQPTPTRQEQLLAHLVECEYCQVTLRVLVEARLDEGSPGSSSEDPVRELLARLGGFAQKKQAHYEQIAAYIETLEARGEKAANKKYPELAEHLKQCKECQMLVKSTRTLIDLVEKSELDQAKKTEKKYC